ncbi:UDP-3-O-(3-hydroxymyristoyl)glucosamine N-acyltransferase [Rhizobium sp. L1K21]|uniref:UDP-3-O-(3-hydroxymyristoyl)glucosamine N-acyltransferase n=1 Tax=Rhizobium sp. L1K21 TaxID=2954933 RepID=UPI002092AC57|nr:UDP-3-O-(3-hydroxymyristoyl)glucosamine N-acyltransferase [Rhizobium sp. L1K21]MCO6185996.1 UDP-3-O-(3-hydroxymyristoyl)glucosamine N-acyltransferase [Rhizobium sp. L1K21]
MDSKNFFPPHAGIRLGDLAVEIGAELSSAEAANATVHSIAPVGRAVEGQICFLRSRRNKGDLETCHASAVICAPALVSLVPEGIPTLVSSNAEAAFARAGAALHPQAMKPEVVSGQTAISDKASIHPSAKLENNIVVEPFAVIGADVSIGAGSHIGVGATIGQSVSIGRNCTIASGASIRCCILGDNVIIHDGARIGLDGFGYAPGSAGMLKLPQIGRVIIQDNVEIGANTTIDRGAMDDTVIGAGTKIDNLVQIGHNVKVGMHCAFAAKVGIAGSTVIGNGVQIGGAAGLNGHIRIGDGVQIAGLSGVAADIPAGEVYGGLPARPIKDFLRETAEILARANGRKKSGDNK